MKKALFLFTIILLQLTGAFCQDTLKTNPIIYLEGTLGGAFGRAKGFDFGLSLNYQFKRNLITVKYNAIADFGYSKENRNASFFFTLPDVHNTYEEFAVLYGLRFINEGHSLGASIGLSQNYRVEYPFNNANTVNLKTNYIGLPFEFTVKWFKPEKERLRIIYGLIPVGKPTGFGNSYGLKIHGNISKNSYVAIGIVSGSGYHKRY